MTDQDERDPLDAIAEEVLERVRLGEEPSVDDYAARFPNLVDQLRDLFPTLLMMEKFGSPDLSACLPSGTTTSSGLRKLGDYVIIREIGRGGMGVVYEAEQESLGRRVALKVLASHSRLDPNQVRRFDREAKSVARLEHPAIVPVYGIGNHKGAPFYVMKLINGQGLDEIIDELRQQRGVGLEFVRPGRSNAAAHASEITCALVAGTSEIPTRVGESVVPRVQNAPGGSPTEHHTAPKDADADINNLPPESTSSGVFPSSTDGTSLSDNATYARTVARIGIHVARALHYAHGQELLHRDVKPSNLLLDTLGQVWVADFGLAKVRSDVDITNTGDFVGTLRYTSPEQLKGWSDPRSDIYSLAITLYELLSLRPAFPTRTVQSCS